MTVARGARWFRWLAIGFGTWNALGAVVVAAGMLRSGGAISREPPAPSGLLVHGAAFAVVATLSFVAAARARSHSRGTWWAALAIGAVEAIAGAFRKGASAEDFGELALLVWVVVVSAALASRSARAPGEAPGARTEPGPSPGP